MTLEEFVRLDPSQIRNSERLMQLFVDFYEAAFSFKPKCAGCAFKKGFKKLRQYSTTGAQKISKFEIMETTKTFQLKKQFRTKILTYRKDGITYRKYGNKITEDFAKELFLDGQTDMFDKLPATGKKKDFTEIIEEAVKISKERTKSLIAKDVNYDTMDYRSELLPLYDQVSERTEKEAESRKKTDIIEFLKANEN